MLNTSGFHRLLLEHNELLDHLYDSMKKDDVAEVCMQALVILKTNKIPQLKKKLKDKAKSAVIRTEGNTAFKARRHQMALELYNGALMVAPKDSEELVLAYGNRSALYFHCKAIEACLNDIETCLSLAECSDALRVKLRKRKEEALHYLRTEKLVHDLRYSKFSKEFFEFKEKRNPHIPCASMDVGVVMKSGVPSVVAAAEVKVGKLLAVEEAFVVAMDNQFRCIACHYCLKICLNLSPCEGCCSVMFCSEQCQKACMLEYHQAECTLVDILEDGTFPISRLAVATALKLRTKFDTWDDFNSATMKLGLKRIKKSDINSIFDGNKLSSLLSFRDDGAFVYGQMYDYSFGCAVVLHYLGSLRTYFPSRVEDKEAAMRGFARAMMYFTIHATQTQVSPILSLIGMNMTTFCQLSNFGTFPFIGKLKHACMPNVLALGLNNKLALVAIQEIKPGTELTIAPLGHWLDHRLKRGVRWQKLFAMHTTACNCNVCSGAHENLALIARPTDAQLKYYRKLNVEEALINFHGGDVPDLFPKCAKALAFLSENPFSEEYRRLYTLFRKCLIDMQDYCSKNILLYDK